MRRIGEGPEHGPFFAIQLVFPFAWLQHPTPDEIDQAIFHIREVLPWLGTRAERTSLGSGGCVSGHKRRAGGSSALRVNTAISVNARPTSASMIKIISVQKMRSRDLFSAYVDTAREI